MTLIYSTGEHDSEEIVELRDEINALDSAFEDAKRAHHREQLERLDRYDALLAGRRPTYPTREHLAGFDQIRAIVHDDGAYGDLHGHPSAADKLAGSTLPSGVHFSASSGRINVYAGAPFKVRTSGRSLQGPLIRSRVDVHTGRYLGTPQRPRDALASDRA